MSSEPAGDATAGQVSLRSVGRSAVILTGATMVAQLIGFARQIFLAAAVGVSGELDAFLIAMAAPVAVVAVLTVGVRMAIVPAYSQAKREQGGRSARRLVGTVLVWMAVIAMAATLLLYWFADAIVAVTGPGLSEGGQDVDAVRYMQLLAPFVVVSVITAMFLAVAQAESMFAPMAVVIVLEPIVTLTVLVSFWDTLGLEGFAVGMLAAALMGLAVVVLATLARHVAPIPALWSRDSGLKELVRHAAPLTLSSVITQINGAFSRGIATTLLSGGASALRFGSSLVSAPFAAFRPAYQTAVYPALVDVSQGQDQTQLAITVERVLRYAIVFFVPFAGLTMALAPVAAGLAYDRGAFDGADLRLTALVVFASAPVVVAWTIQPTLGSALNARRKGAALLAAGVLHAVVGIVLMIVLGSVFGVVGVALATSVVAIVVVCFQGYMLKRVEPNLSYGTVWQTFLRSIVAVLPAVLVVGLASWSDVIEGTFVNRAALLFVGGPASLASYYWLARRLGIAEAASIVAFGKDTLRRVVRRIV